LLTELGFQQFERIKSATYWKEFITQPIVGMDKRVTALSVSFDGQLLLVGVDKADCIHVYNTTDGSYVKKITLFRPSGCLFDLAWTRRGNIVYTAAVITRESLTLQSSDVVTMSLNGSIIARRNVSVPTGFTTSVLFYQSLSVSTDGAIYISAPSHSQQSELTTNRYVYDNNNNNNNKILYSHH
jgi:hypothetical protein